MVPGKRLPLQNGNRARMELDGTASDAHPFQPEDLNIGLGGVDRRRNGGTQLLGSDSNAGTNDGQDQGIFGRRSAGLIANKGLQQIAHVKTPWFNRME
jgi:hypothetical protein